MAKNAPILVLLASATLILKSKKEPATMPEVQAMTTAQKHFTGMAMMVFLFMLLFSFPGQADPEFSQSHSTITI